MSSKFDYNAKIYKEKNRTNSMSNRIEETLQEYGLTNNETRVYLANLKIGSGRANDIAKQANLLRTTTYEVLKTLAEKGIVSHAIKSGVKYFEAADPGKLINILEEKKERLNSILPELTALKASVGEKPTIEIYEGKEGLKTILDDIIKTKPEEILTLSSAKIFEALIYYFPHWIKRRAKEGIKARILQEKTDVIKKLRRQDRKELRQIRYVPRSFKINTHMQIYGGKIAILTLKKDELIGIIIDNQDIVETQRSLFEVLWKTAKGSQLKI